MADDTDEEKVVSLFSLQFNDCIVLIKYTLRMLTIILRVQEIYSKICFHVQVLQRPLILQ